MDIKKLAEEMMVRMKEIIESGQEALPMIFKVNTNDEITVIGVAGMGDREKDSAARLIKNLVNEKETAFVIFLSDSYIKSMKKDEYKPSNVAVRDLPGRREAIMAAVSGKRIETYIASWAYDRDAANKPVFEEKPEWVEGKAFGRFASGNQTPVN